MAERLAQNIDFSSDVQALKNNNVKNIVKMVNAWYYNET